MTEETSSEELGRAVRAFVVENFLFGQNGATLKDGESFLERGIIDSTGILELIGFLEDEFEIEVEDEEMVPENLDSVKRVADYLARKLRG